MKRQGHIEQLIQNLCPNGVKYMPLGEVTYWDKKFNGVDKSLQPQTRKYHYYLANELEKLESENGNIRILYTNNRIAYAEESKLGSTIADAEIVCIPWGGNANIKYYKGKFVTADNRIAIARDPKVLNTKFLYYYLLAHQKEIDLLYRGAGIKHPNMLQVLTIPLPLPPLSIQEEIVRILDAFANLIENINTEIKERERQLELTREAIFSHTNKDWITTTLRDICTNCDNQRKPITARYRKKGIYPYYGASGIVDYVSEYIYDGDFLLISEDGANLLARNTPIAFSIKGKNWVNNHAHVLRFQHMCTQKFVEYYINYIEIEAFVSGGAQPKLNQANLNLIPIPFPPLAEQRAIAEKLDTIEALIANLKTERDLRQQQYEYYREYLINLLK